MSGKIVCRQLDDLGFAARLLLTSFPARRVFAFQGEMGAGKTSLIQALCRVLAVVDVAGSPTFAIVNEYRRSGGESVYHFDFYRIKSQLEALDIGYEEYFFSGHYCFIEWPEKIAELLPEDCVYVKIKQTGKGSARVITF